MRGDDDHADKDTRAKALTLAGVYINPADLDYSCLAVELATATDSLLKQLGDPQRDLQLQAATSDIDAERASEILRESSADQQRNCIAETSSAERMQSYAEEVGLLGPTQLRAYNTIRFWAETTALAKRGDATDVPPAVRLLLLGTAGTGKTVTIKCAVQAARLALGAFDSVHDRTYRSRRS